MLESSQVEHDKASQHGGLPAELRQVPRPGIMLLPFLALERMSSALYAAHVLHHESEVQEYLEKSKTVTYLVVQHFASINPSPLQQ